MIDQLKSIHIELADVLITFQRGTCDSLSPALGNIEFDDGGKQTLMNCVGFIAGTYYAGNITLADKLAKSLLNNLAWRGVPEGAYCKIGSDRCHMSFSFLQYFEVTESEYDSVTENRRTTKGIFNKKYYAMSFNGGIIFHGARHLHCLDMHQDDCKWWSTHT